MPDHGPMILLASADAHGELPELHQEVSRLDILFESLRDRGIDYRHLPYANLVAIKTALRDYRHRIAIFHYAGHADEGRLMLEAELGSADGVAHAEGLAGLLSTQRGLKLVFLNGCSTLPHVDLLLGAGVPAVIATSRAINDAVARDFAITFYEALTLGRQADKIRKGQTIAEAFASAEYYVKAKYTSSPEALCRDLKVKSQDVREVTKGLPWLLRPSSRVPAVSWGLFEDDPLFGLPRLPRDFPTPQVPVRRLEWFRRDDARIFFGRGRAIRALYDSVTGRSGSPILLYYGATGAGKSSVLHAGLMPRLEADHDVRYVRRDPSFGLLGALRQALAAGPDADILGEWRGREQASGTPLIVILDQVEETFTRPLKEPGNGEELAALAQAVRGLGLTADRPRGKLILCFRKEWLQEVEQALAAVAVTEDMIAKVPLDPMDGKDIREAVDGPARDQDLSEIRLKVDDDLPGLIAHDLLSDPDARSAIAPTLQTILSQLWDQVKDRSTRHYSVDLYHTLQGEGLLLRDFLKKQLVALRDTHPTEVGKGFDLEILETHTTPWDTADRQSRSALARQFPNQSDCLPGLLQRLKDLYLLVDPPDDPTAVRPSGEARDAETSLAHDALAPLVQEKYRESSAPAQMASKILASLAARSGSDRGPAPLNEAQLALVDAGFPWIKKPDDHKQHMIDSSRAAVAHQKAHEQSLARWRDRLGVAAGLGLLIASIAAWGFWDRWDAVVVANKQREEQKQNFTVENTLHVSSQAQTVFMSRPPLGLNLAVEAVHRAQQARKPVGLYAEQTLVDLLSQSGGSVLRGPRSSGLRHQVLSVAFSGDGKNLATADERTVSIWRTDNLNSPNSVIHTNNMQITGAWLSHDGKLLAAAGFGSVHLWDISTPRSPLHKFRPMGNMGQTSVSFSHDSKYIIICDGMNEAYVWQLDKLETGIPIANLSNKVDGLKAASFTSNSNDVIAINNGGKVVRWRMNQFDVADELVGSGVGFLSSHLSFSGDGRLLVSTGIGRKCTLLHLDDSGYRSVIEINHGSEIISASPSVDGKLVVTTGYDGIARLWREDQPGKPLVELRGHEGPIYQASFSPDGAMVATAGYDGTARLWSVSQPFCSPLVFNDGNGEVGAGVLAASFSADEKHITTICGDGTIRIWSVDLPTRVLTPLVGLAKNTPSASFSGDGTLVAAAGFDGTVRLWRVGQPQSTGVELNGHNGPLHRVFLNSDGTLVAAANNDGTVRLWRVEQPQSPVAVLGGHEGAVSFISFSRNGRLLLTIDRYWGKAGWDGAAHLWQTDRPDTPLAVLRNPMGRINCASFSGDSTLIATAGSDGKIYLWRVDSLHSPYAVLQGDEGSVDTLSFSGDGKLLAAAGVAVRLWRVAEPDLKPLILRGHKKEIHMLSFSASDKLLATASADGSVRLWTLSIDELIRLAGKTAGRNMSQDEWSAFFSSEPRRRVFSNLPEN